LQNIKEEMPLLAKKVIPNIRTFAEATYHVRTRIPRSDVLFYPYLFYGACTKKEYWSKTSQFISTSKQFLVIARECTHSEVTMKPANNDSLHQHHLLARQSRSFSSQGRHPSLSQSRQALLVQDMPSPGMTLQRVTLEKAVAPLLPRPTAPFDRTERKRAHTSAVYYSECFLRGIAPLIADSAAAEVQGQYDKWWIQHTAYKETSDNSSSTIEYDKTAAAAAHKRLRMEDDEGCRSKSTNRRKYVRTVVDKDSNAVLSTSDVVSISSGPNVVSITSSLYGSCKDSIAIDVVRTDDLPPLEQISTISILSKSSMEAVKNRLIEDLRQSGGRVDTTEATKCLEILQTHFARGGRNVLNPSALRGNWLTISRPTYTECQGKSKNGENLYTLGRVGFDMFKPTGLLCSVQASFNNVQHINPKNPGRPLHVPKKLMHDLNKGECQLHTYE
jgi:hypothetical protein